MQRISYRHIQRKTVSRCHVMQRGFGMRIRHTITRDNTNRAASFIVTNGWKTVHRRHTGLTWIFNGIKFIDTLERTSAGVVYTRTLVPLGHRALLGARKNSDRNSKNLREGRKYYMIAFVFRRFLFLFSPLSFFSLKFFLRSEIIVRVPIQKTRRRVKRSYCLRVHAVSVLRRKIILRRRKNVYTSVDLTRDYHRENRNVTVAKLRENVRNNRACIFYWTACKERINKAKRLCANLEMGINNHLFHSARACVI